MLYIVQEVKSELAKAAAIAMTVVRDFIVFVWFLLVRCFRRFGDYMKIIEIMCVELGVVEI